MTPAEIKTAKDDFIAERIAMMIFDGQMSEKEAIEQAEECWLKYRRHHKIYTNEQVKI